MSRGGKRDNAGRKSTWASGCTREDTVPIRVPKNVKEKVFDYAHRLDAGEDLDCVVKSLRDRIAFLEGELENAKSASAQTSSSDISAQFLDKDRLYKLRDKVLARGVGRYGSDSPVVKEVKKKFTEFIKVLYMGTYD